jgi:ABC-type polysaccharide/polyol phosphate export permease
MKNLKSYIKLFFQLLKTDLIIYIRKVYLGDVIDCAIWVGSILLISTYILPEMGMVHNYGSLIATGAIISVAFWDTWSITTKFISDLEGDQTFQYYLSMPMPSTAYFIKNIVYYSIRGGMQAIFVLPYSKLILMNKFDLTNFCFFKFFIVFVSANVFCATLALIFGSLVENINNIGQVGVRFLFPMWFFGGSQFPWQTLYNLSPKFAYACLLNPLIHAVEAMRTAILGPQGFLPFWNCIIILWFFIFVFGWLGIYRLKKRLDCV